MKKSLLVLLMLLLLSCFVCADEISLSSLSGTCNLSGDSDDEDYVVRFGDVTWSLVATESNVDGVRLRGANRVRSQSLFSLTVIEEETGRIITLNSNVADEISCLVEGNTVHLSYVFEEGITFPLDMTVADDGLHVVIDASQIGESEDLFITSFQLLPFFSDSSSRSSGYFLIPDGEGALLTFNNGREGTYRQEVYSRDYINSSEVRTTEREVVRLPMFGVQKDGNALIVVATQGAGIATLNAQSSSSSNPYNQCWFSYQLRRSENQSIAEDAFQTVYESPRLFQSTIELVITPVDGDGYDDMARTFRQMYVKQSSVTPRTVVLEADVLDLDVFSLLGVPTPFYVVRQDMQEDVFNSVLTSMEGCLDGLLVNFDEWNKDQLEGKDSSDLKWNGFFLSQKERNALFEELSSQGTVVSASYDPLSVSGRNDDVVRNLSDEMVAQYGYKVNSSYRDEESRHYLKNASTADFNLFAEEIFFPAFQTAGEISYSDYNSAGGMDKDSYCRTVREKLSQTGHPYAVYGGSWYSLENCFHVLDAPVQNSGLRMLDTAVPFYEMALSGCISYSFESVNTVSDPELLSLKMLESGASPSFLIDKNTDPAFNEEYLDEWMPALSLCAGQEIISHEILSDSVRRTAYANGVTVTVDYASRSYEIGGGK